MLDDRGLYNMYILEGFIVGYYFDHKQSRFFNNVTVRVLTAMKNMSAKWWQTCKMFYEQVCRIILSTYERILYCKFMVTNASNKHHDYYYDS